MHNAQCIIYNYSNALDSDCALVRIVHQIDARVSLITCLP